MAYYVYIIQSQNFKSYYKGSTDNLKRRINEHNSGKVKTTMAKRPYILKWYGTFPAKKKAYDFERYLKTGSGIAFTNKHLL